MTHRLRAVTRSIAFTLIATLAASAIAATPASAQGEQVTRTVDLAPFTILKLEGGGEATLEFGPTPSVTIEGNSLIVDRLEASVDDGILTLGSPLTSALDVTGLSELRYTIVTPSIEEIHLAGTVSLTIAAVAPQPSLHIGLTTAAHLTIGAMDVATLTGKLDLLSRATLAGSAKTMQLEINNGSELEAADLQVGSADLVLNGVAKATVRVTDALTGRAAQGSTVQYISQTVVPAITLTTMATVSPLAYTPWTPPAILAPTEATPTN